VLCSAQQGWIVSKKIDEIDLHVFHGVEPLLVNKLLCPRRHSMDAAVVCESFVTEVEVQSRLHQCGE